MYLRDCQLYTGVLPPDLYSQHLWLFLPRLEVKCLVQYPYCTDYGRTYDWTEPKDQEFVQWWIRTGLRAREHLYMVRGVHTIWMFVGHGTGVRFICCNISELESFLCDLYPGTVPVLTQMKNTHYLFEVKVK